MSNLVRCTCELVCRLENPAGLDISREKEREHRRRDLLRGANHLQQARGLARRGLRLLGLSRHSRNQGRGRGDLATSYTSARLPALSTTKRARSRDSCTPLDEPGRSPKASRPSEDAFEQMTVPGGPAGAKVDVPETSMSEDPTIDIAYNTAIHEVEQPLRRSSMACSQDFLPATSALEAYDDHNIDDMYYSPPHHNSANHTDNDSTCDPPMASIQDLRPLLQVGSEAEREEQLGLYDDPEDLDELQLSIANVALEIARPNDGDGNPTPAAEGERTPGAGTMPVPQASQMAGSQAQPQPDEDVPAGDAHRGDDALSEPDAQDVYASLSSLPGITSRGSVETIYRSSHDKWFVRSIILMVAYLHTRHHVTFRCATIILFTVRAIFIGLGLLDIDDPMPMTFTTALKRLELTDRFHILPACSQCRRLFRPDIAPTTRCPDCGGVLFSQGSVNIILQLLGTSPRRPIPRFAAPLRPLSVALLEILIARPELLDKLDDWRKTTSPPGHHTCIQDGRIWKTLVGSDGLLFFGPQQHGEARIGVIYHLDWFSFRRSPYAPSHSSGIISFSIANLERLLRYRVEHMLPCAVTPGPGEPNAEELQYYQEILMDDLLILFHEGILVPRPSPQPPKRARVACVCASLDHPGMCKCGGFADKNHAEDPCPKCEVASKDMYEWITRSLTEELPLRDDHNHRALGDEWRALAEAEDGEQAAHFKRHGTRWTAFSKLPYFDIPRMMVIDPMHNLLLGEILTHLYRCSRLTLS
ncbi:hypothetical protein FKP32DRAFT_768228 [Trametes sanguinea]|nr:hypothetical protein FKP32DRAFT_768228 [Trametes sanguinea]